jgi:peptidoglycan hydrolase-like protein with peptidoglycan-binding domain
VSKISRSIFLAAALAATVAYIATPTEQPSSSGQYTHGAIESIGPIGSRTDASSGGKHRSPQPEASPPDATTTVVLSRMPRREAAMPPTRSFDGDPFRLVQELQRELRRLGCYPQEINGEWTPASRRAMKDFTERVNAVLPLDAPDPVLLALLRSEKKPVCGDACPEGQALTKDNRCLPSALLGLPPPKLAALLERADNKKSIADASTAPPATPPAASVASTYRARRPPNNFGSWVFGLFGW